MTRSKPVTVFVLTTAAMLILSGCHTTVVEPAPQPTPQPAHHDFNHSQLPDDFHRDDHKDHH